MAQLISLATGNFTASTTWALVDSTSFLDSQISANACGTSFVNSPTWTPGAITVDGIAIQLQSSVLASGGTFTVQLYNSTGAVQVDQVTINVSDLPVGTPLWVFFKFGSTHTLLAATAYSVGVKVSVLSSVSVYRNGTANNWSRALRTTTTQAPAAGDQTIICGSRTAAATFTSVTVTMDSISNATSYGKMQISDLGTLNSPATASTNYLFTQAGNLEVWDGGTISLVPAATSTLVWTFACTSAVLYGFEARGGTVTITGATKDPARVLSADAAIAGTSLTLDTTPTGWGNTDLIVVEATTRTNTEAEQVAMSAQAGAVVTIAALANAHSGSGLTKANVLNITRSITFQGNTTTFTAYVNISFGCTFNVSYTRFTMMGSGTALKRGIDANPASPGSVSLTYCTMDNFSGTSAIGLNASSSSYTGLTVDHCVFYNITTQALQTLATTGTWTITNNWFCKNVTSGNILVLLKDVGGTFTGNVMSSSVNIGLYCDENGTFVAFSGNVAHSNSSTGMYFQLVISWGGTSSGGSSWRNGGNGFQVALGGSLQACAMDSFTTFGNSTGGFDFIGPTGDCLFTNCIFDAGTTLVQAIGISFEVYTSLSGVIFRGCTFGANQTFATADISIPLAVNNLGTTGEVLFDNCKFNSTTTLQNQTLLGPHAIIRSMNHNQVAGARKVYKASGTESNDTTVIHVAAQSARLTPRSASVKHQSGDIYCDQQINVDSGATPTVYVWLRKSVVGDGAAYNGSQPRLMLRACPSAGVGSTTGVPADTVVATASVAAGTWGQISGVLPAPTMDVGYELYVDCDGTAGWVNVAEWSVA